MQIIFISLSFRVSQLHWLGRNKKLGMVFHNKALRGTSVAPEVLGQTVGRSMCERRY